MRSEEIARGGGKKRKKPQWADKTGWEGFVDIPLTDDDRARIADDLSNLTPGEALAFIDRWAAEGYKVGLSADPAHDCYIVSLTGKSPDCVNRGYTLVARGPDAFGAVVAMNYKHDGLCRGEEWAQGANENQRQIKMFD
jgi:hypothetical protein